MRRDDYEDEMSFRLAVQNEFASFEHIGERLGIGLIGVPVRARDGNGWFTAAWIFKTATVPAATREEPEPHPEPELEPVMVPAEFEGPEDFQEDE